MNRHPRIRRAFLTLGAVAMLIASSLATAPSAFAAGPIGPCTSSSDTSYQSGETDAGKVVNGVQADLQVPNSSNFGPCTPNDNSGANVSSVNIGIAYGSAWVEIGILICNSKGNTDIPAASCNGSRRYFAEQHGQAFWDWNFWDLGQADLNAHTMRIEYNNSTGNYDFKIDGVVRVSKNMGGGLVPTQPNNSEYFQFETKDPGSGLGQNLNGYSTNIGRMFTYYDGAWRYLGVGTSCDQVSVQHHCVPNGTVGMYAYTTN